MRLLLCLLVFVACEKESTTSSERVRPAVAQKSATAHQFLRWLPNNASLFLQLDLRRVRASELWTAGLSDLLSGLLPKTISKHCSARFFEAARFAYANTSDNHFLWFIDRTSGESLRSCVDQLDKDVQDGAESALGLQAIEWKQLSDDAMVFFDTSVPETIATFMEQQYQPPVFPSTDDTRGDGFFQHVDKSKTVWGGYKNSGSGLRVTLSLDVARKLSGNATIYAPTTEVVAAINQYQKALQPQLGAGDELKTSKNDESLKVDFAVSHTVVHEYLEPFKSFGK